LWTRLKRNADVKEGEEYENRNENLLTHFLNSVDENGKPFECTYLRDMLMNILLESRRRSFSFFNIFMTMKGKVGMASGHWYPLNNRLEDACRQTF